jgi:hypothetical protein
MIECTRKVDLVTTPPEIEGSIGSPEREAWIDQDQFLAGGRVIRSTAFKAVARRQSSRHRLLIGQVHPVCARSSVQLLSRLQRVLTRTCMSALGATVPFRLM